MLGGLHIDFPQLFSDASIAFSKVFLQFLGVSYGQQSLYFVAAFILVIAISLLFGYLIKNLL